MGDFLSEYDFYNVDYSGLSRNGVVPKIKPIIAHAKRRFKQRFGEEFEGPYGSAYNTIAGLINKGMSELDLYQCVDYYFGFVADKVVHNIALMGKVRFSYYDFIEQHRRDKRSDEDWYAYCVRVRNKTKKFNQSGMALDTILMGLCINIPTRKLKVLI